MHGDADGYGQGRFRVPNEREAKGLLFSLVPEAVTVPATAIYGCCRAPCGIKSRPSLYADILWSIQTALRMMLTVSQRSEALRRVRCTACPRNGGYMRTHSQLLVGTFIFLALTATAFAGEARPLSIGINFTGSSYGIDSFYIPPDTDAAVGPRHIVELINGHYAVYLKTDGTRVQSTSMDQFWRNAGVIPRSGFPADPRVLFDPFSHRWFASTASINFGNGPDDLLLTVSNGADPTQGWTGFTIPFAGPVANFVDAPALGFDRDGVFLFTSGTVVVVPKSDLLAAPPTVAHATLVQSRDLLTPSGTRIQPVVNLSNTGLPE